MEALKICRKCSVPKPEKDFYTRSDNGKLDNTCKACVVKRVKNPISKKLLLPAVFGEKVCSKCATPKPLADFQPRRDRPGQHYTVCKTCRNEKEVERRMRTINKNKRYATESDLITYVFDE